MPDEQKKLPDTDVTTPQTKEKEISPEEADRLFNGGELRLDRDGKPIPQGADDTTPREGASLNKRHAWYKKKRK